MRYGGPFDDPYFEPPEDIQGEDARAYEEKIVAMLREALLPGSGAHPLHAIALRGTRPDTEIVFRYADQHGVDRAASLALWKREYPTSGATYGKLHAAASVGGWVCSSWLASELEPIDLDRPC